MQRKLLAALVISASIGGQVLSAATKVGVLTFALSDTYQQNILQNGAQTSLPSATETFFNDCAANLKFVTKTEKIDTAVVIKAIGTALKVTFTKKAQLVIYNYDNIIPAPPYPPYLVNQDGVVSTDPTDIFGTKTYNGPREGSQTGGAGNFIAAMGQWPNEKQIDWVEYDKVDANGDVGADRWPKSLVTLSDPTNPDTSLQCLEVTPFFSFEEAFCYFCWDTVDRVTSGTLANISDVVVVTGDVCLGGASSSSSCGVKGSGTTKWYMTIKFNNNPGPNVWVNQEGTDQDEHVIDLPYGTEVSDLGQLSVINQEVIIAVSGVVTYPWKIKTIGAVGNMTMTQANGYGNNPYCGVLTGSVKITETDNSKFPCIP